MYRIAICDDDKDICNGIDRILWDYARTEKISLDVEVFYQGSSLYQALTEGESFHLLLLDVEMPDINGLKIGEKIRKQQNDYDTEIIYISGKPQYARQMLSFRPLYFIEKPFLPQDITACVSLAMSLHNQEKGFYRFQANGIWYKIRFGDILYFESYGRKNIIFTTKAQHVFYGNFQNLAESLPDNFVQIHRSYIINVHRTLAFAKDYVVMENGITIKVGNTYQDRFVQLQLDEMRKDF